MLAVTSFFCHRCASHIGYAGLIYQLIRVGQKLHGEDGVTEDQRKTAASTQRCPISLWRALELHDRTDGVPEAMHGHLAKAMHAYMTGKKKSVWAVHVESSGLYQRVSRNASDVRVCPIRQRGCMRPIIVCQRLNVKVSRQKTCRTARSPQPPNSGSASSHPGR